MDTDPMASALASLWPSPNATLYAALGEAITETTPAAYTELGSILEWMLHQFLHRQSQPGI